MAGMADKSPKSYAEQLSNFASELRDHIDDEAMLSEIHVAIKTMLSSDGASENQIRNVLQQQLDRGDLRKESFQLVQKLIDNIVSEDIPTDSNGTSVEDKDPFGSTTIIEKITFDKRAVDEHLQVGSVLRDRFMLTEEVAGGSMGTVYKAMDRRLAEADSADHWVAIKVLSPKLSNNADALRALQQEAVKTRCLTHPNIVRFIDLDRDDELYFMVMEWLEGRSLADILDDRASKKIELKTALDIVKQIGRALDYAHQRGIVHADVKPGNVMITPTGQAKLYDFGIARIRQKQSARPNEFDPGILSAATPAYSSMQVLTGEDPVAADDVFSLACLTYRLIAGYRVFGPRNAAEAAEAGMEPQQLESLSKAQWQALKKALSYSRVARYSSPLEFVDALTGGSSTASVSGAMKIDPDDTFNDRFEAKSSKPWRYVAMFLILVAAIAIVWENDIRRLIATQVNQPQTIPVANEAETTAGPSEGMAGSAIDPIAELTGGESDPAPDVIADAALSEEEIVSPPQDPADEEIEPEPGATEEATASGVINGTDFASLPPANIIIPLAGPGDLPGESSITLTEDGEIAIVDFVRASNLDETLKLHLVEVKHSGNRSPLDSGQYSFSDNGIIDFPSGQHRARLTIAMASDPLREPDYQVTLVVRDVAFSDIEFATIRLALRDDDQRAFENRLAPNTVAFAVSQVSVRERDPAVQIDVIRFKPDGSSLQIGYSIRDVTATEGEDYIAPQSGTVLFGPGQRSARILIPLVQDDSREADEAFMLELTGEPASTQSNIYRRIAVMIRDDDS
jgi:serine/threonine protein kinase